LAVTLAVKVTSWWKTEGLAEEARAVGGILVDRLSEG
jgi:hypothetical protein